MTPGLGDRTAFLDRLRARLEGGLPESAVRPLLPASAGPFRYTVDLDDLPAVFAERAGAAGAEVHDCPDGPGALLEEICGRYEIRSALVAHDPECGPVPSILAQLGVRVLGAADPDVPSAQLGVSGALWMIALTGSLVVDASRSRWRAPSLLPPVHVALVRRGALVDTPGSVWRGLEAEAQPLPSALVVITGPSRSADIELELTLGVHGPRHVVIGLLP